MKIILSKNSEAALVLFLILGGLISLLMGLIGFFVSLILRCMYKFLSLLGTLFLILNFDWLRSKKVVPPIGSRRILTLSATEIAQKIRNHEVTVEEVVRLFIDRIKEVNPLINSVVGQQFDLAIAEAQEKDRRLQSDRFIIAELEIKYPLYGVPFTVKDSIAVKGLYHTAGLWERRFIRALDDADVVDNLRKRGAIPLGVTNMSELGMWWESVNLIYGSSSNPYDTRCTSGGSSGGEAGLQAACGSCFGIGSDVGGSIRMPAFFSGVFGYKPTSGLISSVGQEPRTSGRIREFFTVGILARHSVDLKLIFNLILLEDWKYKLKGSIELKRLRLFYMMDDGGNPLSTPIEPQLKSSMLKTVYFLEEKLGVKAQRVNIKKMRYSLGIWADALSNSGSVTFCEELGMRRRKVNPFWELMKFPFGLSNHTFPAILLGIFEKLLHIRTYLQIHKDLQEITKSLALELEDLLRDDGILIYPSHPTQAPRHKRAMFSPFDFSYGAVFNILGLPALQIPLGLGDNGLPLGVQVVAGKHNDLFLLDLAQQFDNPEIGGWVPPS